MNPVEECRKINPKTVEEFEKILNEMLETFCKKQLDYGPQNITLGGNLEKDDEKTRIWIYHSIYRNWWYKCYFFSMLLFHIILLYSQPSSPDQLNEVCFCVKVDQILTLCLFRTVLIHGVGHVKVFVCYVKLLTLCYVWFYSLSKIFLQQHY